LTHLHQISDFKISSVPSHLKVANQQGVAHTSKSMYAPPLAMYETVKNWLGQHTIYRKPATFHFTLNQDRSKNGNSDRANSLSLTKGSSLQTLYARPDNSVGSGGSLPSIADTGRFCGGRRANARAISVSLQPTILERGVLPALADERE
jgi:hypothetical protein